MGYPSSNKVGAAERDRTLLEINNAIITKLTQAELFDAICQALERTIPFDRVALVIHEPENDVLRIAALAGPHQSNHFVVGLALDNDSASRWVFDHQMPLLRHDLETEQQPGTEKRYYEEGIRSICTLPLMAGTRTIGAIGLGSKTRGTYSEIDVPFLLQVARQVALAISNMKAYEAIAALNIQVAHSEQRWRAVYENSAVGVALTDLQGRFIAANRAYQSMLGYTEDELRSLTFLELTHQDDRAANWTAAAELLEGKRTQFQLEKRYRRKDGSLIWVRNCASIVPGSGNVPGFMMAISEDIGERIRAQEALQRSEERARTLLEINNAIITSLTEGGLLSSISKALHRVVPFDASALVLYVPESDRFRILAVEGMVRHFHVGQELSHENTSVGWAFDRKHYLLRHDLVGEGQYANERLLVEEGMRSHCVVPLMVRGGCIGTLNLASRTSHQYSEGDAVFLQEVATQIALAIQNMQTYEEIAALHTKVTRAAERSRTLLEINNAIITCLTQQSLLQSVSEVVRKVIPGDGCLFTLYQPERETFRYLSVDSDFSSEYFRAGLEFDPKDSASGWAFQHRRAVIRRNLEKEQQFSNDSRLLAEGIHSDCVVPMLARGKAIGTLNVGSKDVNQYSDQDAEFLQEVATQVALAVENMQAYEEINALKTRVEAENVYLQEEILRQHNFDEIVGNSPALLDVLRRVEIVAPTEATVLLYGETGTGKELLARAIHSRSPRSGRAMVTVNCGAIPSGLVESELFGHVKGAFTGALQNATGRFELADGSTLFLDEVGELPAETQVKLLRVLQEHEFQPVGSSRTKRVDVRIIAATNRNLEEDVRSGRFRPDLFYRLNVVPLWVPALRERRSDIPELVLFFLQRSSQKIGKKIDSVSQDTLKHLVAYQWPGNIRELQNVIERGVVLSRGSVLSLDRDLLPLLEARTSPNAAADNAGKPQGKSPSLGKAPVQEMAHNSLEAVERGHIQRVLDSTGGIIDGPRGAAHVLKLHPSTLRARMKKLRIHRPRH
jgi:formate hydrogenlyase transcriptional activator